jgi:hypothetical protein
VKGRSLLDRGLEALRVGKPETLEARFDQVLVEAGRLDDALALDKAVSSTTGYLLSLALSRAGRLAEASPVCAAWIA